MTPSLKSITLTDFRSIRGTQSTSLEAPIVLIHGPNGSGKTSILSGIELALTGHIPSLARVEPDYVSHLVHKQAHAGKVSLTVSGLKTTHPTAELFVDGNGISGSPALDASQSRFFSERCYLAQSALGRLLEIYQHKDTRQGDSPLTQFVKDLLGLDRLDALIDGLHDAGNIRRLRQPVPIYYEVRDGIEALEKEIASLAAELLQISSTLQSNEARLVGTMRAFDNAPEIADIDATIQKLQANPEEKRLDELARLRRDIVAALDEWAGVSQTTQSEQRERCEQEANAARSALDQWSAVSGQSLERIVTEVASLFADLQLPTATNPEHARSAAARAVEKELDRCTALLDQDARDMSRLDLLGRELERASARSQRLDQQIQSISANVGQLAQALAGLIPHIHTDNCPVCSRNFREISKAPLEVHVSGRVAELTESAGRLQSLSKEKAAATSTIATLDRERTQLSARQISIETRDALKMRRARLSELSVQLADLAAQTATGMQLIVQLNSVAARLDQLRSRDQRTTNLRATVAELAQALNTDTDSTLATGDALLALRGSLDAQYEALVSLQAARGSAVEQARELKSLRVHLRQRQEVKAATELSRIEFVKAKDQADIIINTARDLAHRARDVRTNIVRRVFNDSLNAIWRDLFVRLAPDEDFVPAFALPEGPGTVEALLETIYRAGGKGGNPSAMLSAGNLNTAALTLFLALHLSARPQLPWLIIDDPVQSMDELHIAQFAVLLRTLSKGHDRQIILAVHERALFDYLALELSPAFPDDRLITVELGRAPDGATTLQWKPHTYEKDNAIAA